MDTNNVKKKGKIYDIQGFSVHDGPGIRTTVFLKGCPLRCPWCHSPESQAFPSQMSYIAAKCIGTGLCGECVRVCPAGAVVPGEEEDVPGGSGKIRRAKWSRADCRGCTKCTEVCFPAALDLCGKDYTTDEVMAKLRKDFNFFQSSGGGVTISGGEPLCQPEFTIELLKKLKAEGIHTAVDTTGFVQTEIVARALPYTDLFLYDIKHMNSAEHKRIMGVPNEIIHENARYIAKNGGKLQVRIPVIPTYNDSMENLEAAAEFIAELGDAVTVVQLLPYHHFGASKYERIQMYDPMPADLKPPTDETMEVYRQMMEKHGLNAIIH